MRARGEEIRWSVKNTQVHASMGLPRRIQGNRSRGGILNGLIWLELQSKETRTLRGRDLILRTITRTWWSA